MEIFPAPSFVWFVFEGMRWGLPLLLFSLYKMCITVLHCFCRGVQSSVWRCRDLEVLSLVLVRNVNSKNYCQRFTGTLMLSQIPMGSIYGKCCNISFIDGLMYLVSFSERSRASITIAAWKPSIIQFFLEGFCPSWCERKSLKKPALIAPARIVCKKNLHRIKKRELFSKF